jgi:surface polysaccharide O-acyltransferase-like enzyme
LAIGAQLILTFTGIGGPNALTRWLPFVGFFLAGALLRDVAATRRRIRWAVVVAVVSIVATALGTALLVGPLGFGLGRGRYLYEYPSVTTVPASLAVFALLVWLGPGLSRRMSSRTRAVIASAAAASFGIYLVHPMVLVGLSRLGISARSGVAPVAFTLTVTLAFLITWAIVAIMRRIPYVRAIV